METEKPHNLMLFTTFQVGRETDYRGSTFLSPPLNKHRNLDIHCIKIAVLPLWIASCVAAK